MNRDQFRAETLAIGVELTDFQLDTFESFEEALYNANEVMNLTRVPREECWSRHFLDSLLIAPLIGDGVKVLDIGCGPGFPSWPLAAARPDLHVTGMDSNGKMLGFLKSQLLPNLEVNSERAEECQLHEKFDFVTGRAVAPLAIQAEISAQFVRIGGFFVPMRTAHDTWEEKPMNCLGLELVAIEERTIAGVIRKFPIFRKSRPTQRKFPRKWAEIKKKPLF